MRPFNMLIVGHTDCGKTYYLLKMLEETYKKQFENIFLICPTFKWNKTYLEWSHLHDPNFFVIPCDQDYVENYLKFVVDYCKKTDGESSLIILDDCASGQFVKNRTSELVKLGFGGRHFNISTIVLTQQLTSIAKSFRENISKLTSFYNPCADDMEFLYNKYLKIKKSEKEKKIDEIEDILKTVSYSRLEISLRKPYCYEVVRP